MNAIEREKPKLLSPTERATLRRIADGVGRSEEETVAAFCSLDRRMMEQAGVSTLDALRIVRRDPTPAPPPYCLLFDDKEEAEHFAASASERWSVVLVVSAASDGGWRPKWRVLEVKREQSPYCDDENNQNRNCQGR